MSTQAQRFENIAIVGVGLIGASFGLALKKAGFTGEIIGVSSPGAIEAALRLGAIDRAAPLQIAAAEADMVYLAQPISRILETIATIDQWLRPGALVTDAGSTKLQIVEHARRHIRRGVFLGGHPMAGKEKSGAAEAEAGLFRGRTYVLTPSAPEDLERPAARELLGWIEAIGARPAVFSPAHHDRIVAFTSHLPQLLSTTLALVVSQEARASSDLQAAGPALRDMTRLAASSYEIWGDILSTNTAEIDRALTLSIETLHSVQRRLQAGDLRSEFDAANGFAVRLGRGAERP